MHLHIKYTLFQLYSTCVLLSYDSLVHWNKKHLANSMHFPWITPWYSRVSGCSQPFSILPAAAIFINPFGSTKGYIGISEASYTPAFSHDKISQFKYSLFTLPNEKLIYWYNSNKNMKDKYQYSKIVLSFPCTCKSYAVKL